MSPLHTHALEQSVSKGGWFINYQCDVCKNPIASGVEKYSCAPCSFDLCSACFERGGPPPTPAKASAGWWGMGGAKPEAPAAVEVPVAHPVTSHWSFQRGMDANAEMKLKYNVSATSPDMEKAIRARFSIPDSDRLVVVDPSDGCDVVLCAGLARGITFRVFTTAMKGTPAIPLPK